MADNSYSRHWEGVNDPVHPLSRTAHSAISHGRYIYVLNGYGPSDNKMVLFDQIGLTRYDILTNCVEFLPIHWDAKSLQYHMFSESILLTSGNSAVINAESVSTNDEPACIYTFGGYSILGNIHVNALCRIELTHHNLPKYTTSDHQNQSGKVTSTGLRSHCCHASVVSGHGILSCLSYLPQDNALHESISLTMLKSFQRQLEYHHPANIHNRFDSIHDNVSHNCHHLLPSPRDKLCMEYWRGRLYVFGGYGPSFMPYSTWPKQIFHWPYLHDPNDETNWIICDSNGGWNSQLIIYDISENRWELVTRLDAIGRFPTPRAAHCSSLLPNHGWMIIFGGRGPYHQHSSLQQPSDFRMGRLNDMYCLNLHLMEWTQILTPLDIPQPRNPIQSIIWPCGRSWMDMITMHEPSCMKDYCTCREEGEELNDEIDFSQMDEPGTIQLFILGGWSNNDEALNDAFLVNINPCRKHKLLEAKVVSSTKEIHTSTNNTMLSTTENHSGFETNLNKWQYSSIQPLCDTLRKPTVLNGFMCSNQQSKCDTYSNLIVNSDGKVLTNETFYMDIITSLYLSTVTDPTTETTKTHRMDNASSSNNDNNNPLDWDTDDMKLFLRDLNYHLCIYKKLSFNVDSKKLKKSVGPEQALYRIALLHTMFTQYLVKSYCRFAINKNSSPTATTTTNNNNNNADGTSSRLIEELDNLCASYRLILEPNQTLIISLLMGIFLKFMLPWQLFQMLLQEQDSWLTSVDSKELIRNLLPDLNIHEFSLRKSSLSRSSIYQLDFNDQSIIDKFMLLLSPGRIHMPINHLHIHQQYIGNSFERFSYNLQQIVTSAFIWCAKLPLHYDIVNGLTKLSDNDSLQIISSLSSDSLSSTRSQPVHRHWHTITLGLDRRIYAIGGTTREALETPIECYDFHRPMSLSVQSFTKVSKIILSTFLNAIQHNISITDDHNNTKRIQPLQLHHYPVITIGKCNHKTENTLAPFPCHLIKDNFIINYLNNLDKSLKELLNSHVKYLLEEWLL